MAALACAVGGYGLAVSFVPGFQPAFVRELLASWPLIAVCHFSGGGVALIVGAFQFNGRLRARLPRLHRWAGRVHVLAVAIGGLAGLIMALDASGGPIARVGFSLLALLWLFSTGAAYVHIRQRNVGAHRTWMIRGYALTLAAVTLRIYLPISLLAGVPMAVAYPAIAWLCWVPNLLIAEWLLRKGFFALAAPRVSFEPQPTRESA
jgi:uncharacterized membrane protein